MTEQRALEEVQRALEDKYGASRVVREPVLGVSRLSLRPDLLVFKDEERITPFLALEYSSLSTPHRRTEDIKQVRQYIEKTGSPFGAIVSDDLLYIFRIDRNDELIEVPVSEYPDIGDEPDAGPQPIGSHELFEFLIARMRDQLRSSHHQQVSEEFAQQLYRNHESIRVASETSLTDLLDIDIGKELSDRKRRITDQIEEVKQELERRENIHEENERDLQHQIDYQEELIEKTSASIEPDSEIRDRIQSLHEDLRQERKEAFQDVKALNHELRGHC